MAGCRNGRGGGRRRARRRLAAWLIALGAAAAPAAADLSGLGVPQSAARLPFGLPQTADPLGGLGRKPSALNAPIASDFDRPLFRLTPGTRPGPAPAVAPVAPVRTPAPKGRPTPAERRFDPINDRRFGR